MAKNRIIFIEKNISVISVRWMRGLVSKLSSSKRFKVQLPLSKDFYCESLDKYLLHCRKHASASSNESD